MGITENKQLAERFIACLRVGDLDGLLAVLSPDTIWWDPIRGELDNDRYLAAVRQFAALYASPFELTIHGMVAEDDRVAVELESLVTLSNGAVYNNKYHMLLRMQNRRIVQVKEYLDTKHVMDIVESLQSGAADS